MRGAEGSVTSEGSSRRAWGDGGTELLLVLSLDLWDTSLPLSARRSLRNIPFPPFLWVQAAALVLSILLEWLLLLLWLLRDPSPLSKAPALHGSGPELLRAQACAEPEKRWLCHLIPLMLEIVLISSLFPRHRAQNYFSRTEQTRC